VYTTYHEAVGKQDVKVSKLKLLRIQKQAQRILEAHRPILREQDAHAPRCGALPDRSTASASKRRGVRAGCRRL